MNNSLSVPNKGCVQILVNNSNVPSVMCWKMLSMSNVTLLNNVVSQYGRHCITVRSPTTPRESHRNTVTQRDRSQCERCGCVWHLYGDCTAFTAMPLRSHRAKKERIRRLYGALCISQRSYNDVTQLSWRSLHA